MRKLPENHQKVEISVNDKWIPATFYAADYYPANNEDGDESWWMDYFMLEDYSTIPEDIQSGEELLPWRRNEKKE